MSQVEFNDENKNSSLLYAKFQSSNELPTLVRWIMSAGLAKTPEAANAILIGIAIVAVAVTGIVVYRMNSGGAVQKLTPAQQQAMEQAMRNMQNPTQ